MNAEDFGMDPSGLSEETKLVLEQAMKALSFKSEREAGVSRTSRLSSLGKLSDYEAQSSQPSEKNSPPGPTSGLSPATLPAQTQSPTRAAPPVVERSQNGNSSYGADEAAIPWRDYPVYRKVDDLTSDVDVSVSQLTSQAPRGMVPGYRSSGQIAVPRQAQPYAARQQPVPGELASHLREAVDKDIAALVDQIKSRAQADAMSGSGSNLANPTLTDEDEKLLYQEIYGYGSEPPSSMHSSRSASPSSRRRHDWHADFYVNRQELLGAESISGSEGGSVRGSMADVSAPRPVAPSDPLRTAGNPLLSPGGQALSTIAPPHRIPNMSAQMAQMTRAAPPPPPPSAPPVNEQPPAEAGKAAEPAEQGWSVQSRPLAADETVVKLQYLDTVKVPQPDTEANLKSGPAFESVVDVPEELQRRSVAVNLNTGSPLILDLKRAAEPPFNFSSASSLPYGAADPLLTQRSEPPLSYGPSLLASQRSDPGLPLASQAPPLFSSQRAVSGTVITGLAGSEPPFDFKSHTASLLSSQRFPGSAEPPFNFTSVTAPIQVASPVSRPALLTGASPVRGLAPVPQQRMVMSAPMPAGYGLHASAPAVTTQLNQSFGSDVGSYSFSDVYQSSDLGRPALRSSVTFGATPPLRAVMSPQALLSMGPPASLNTVPGAPWREDGAPPSSIAVSCTAGKSGAVAKVAWAAGAWTEAVFELQIMLLSVTDTWRTAFVGGDASCTIPSLRFASAFALRVRASDAQSSSSFSDIAHFTTPSPPADPAPPPSSAASAPPPVEPAAPPPAAKASPPLPAAAPAASPPVVDTTPESKAPDAEPAPMRQVPVAVATAQKAAPPPPPVPAEAPPAQAAAEAIALAPSPRVLKVTEAKALSEAESTQAAPPTPPAVREAAQESSDVGDYVSFSGGYWAQPVLSSGPSYAVWADRDTHSGLLTSSLRPYSGPPPGSMSRSFTSAPYSGTSYGSSVGGHALITPIQGAVRYNTGTDIRYSSGTAFAQRSPPAVTFSQAGSRAGGLYASGPASGFVSSPVRTHTVTHSSFA